MTAKRTGVVFLPFFALVLLSAWVWLALGLAPVLAAVWEPIHEGFHDRDNGDGLLGEIMRNAGQAAHGARSGGQAALDYIFSAFNIGLGILLLRLKPADTTARLLAVGMVGTAVAFNLQGHDAFQVVPAAWLSWVDRWHVGIHVASGLCYIFALLRFPADRLVGRDLSSKLGRLPVLVSLAVFFTLLSMFTADDHTLGLVLVYGLFIPLAGVTAQARRIRRAPSDEQRQQSKVLLSALVLAVLVAVPLMVLGSGGESEGGGAGKTVDYEFTAPAPGTYFFRCDPHPVEMRGELHVISPSVGDNQGPIEILAKDNRFDSSSLELTSGSPTLIRFTNLDSDLHNVAIYRTSEAKDPLFIGAEFSGRETAVVAFRAFRIVFAVIPLALFIGLVRFRLWDIDRVINRGLVYGALAAFITGVYLVVVVGLGSLIGAGQRLSIFLSVAVTAILAAIFHPVRDRARKLANRLVYGNRATPYEVLAELSERVGSTYSMESVIPEMAVAIAQGTGAKSAEVWLRVGNEMQLSAAWPPRGPSRDAISLGPGAAFPSFPHADRAVEVGHGEELLGAITIVQTPGRRLTPVEERLLDDVAAQAGLVLRNAQLTVELEGRLQELRRSRQRIVVAQDAERRRLERDIHDGAQQDLVALSMKLRQAQDLATSNPPAAKGLLEELQADTGVALQTLRDLARGVYPPVLADKGLVHALEAHARRCPVPVKVTVGRVKRLDADIEAAVYFCCLEAIQNSLKHSGGPIQVILEVLNGRLGFRVKDSGPGFDPGVGGQGAGLQHMEDRIAAVGGTLEVSSTLGSGVVVEGWIPLPSPAHA